MVGIGKIYQLNEGQMQIVFKNYTFFSAAYSNDSLNSEKLHRSSILSFAMQLLMVEFKFSQKQNC